MVKTMGVEPKKFMSQGVPVKALYSRGVKVWPVQPVEGDTDFSITINSGADSSFILPTSGRLNNTNNGYAWIVDWGDGTTSNHNGTGTTTSGIEHAYPQANTHYKIKIKPQNPNELGWLRAFGFYDSTSGSNDDINKQKVLIANGQLTEQMIRVSASNTYVCAFWFYGCANLKMSENFNLPQDITSVGDNFCLSTFYCCTTLKMNDIFQLPQKLTRVGGYFCYCMFRRCTSITMNDIFQLPQSLTTVGNNFCALMFDGWFDGCINLKMNAIFQLPPGITSIGIGFCEQMFRNCPIISMNAIFQLPQRIMAANEYFCRSMFENCKSLMLNDVFQLPQGITSSGGYFCCYMFYACAITTGVRRFFGSLVLSQTDVNRIATYQYTFRDCAKLTETLSDIPQLQIIPSGRRNTFQGCPPALIAPLHPNWK